MTISEHITWLEQQYPAGTRVRVSGWDPEDGEFIYEGVVACVDQWYEDDGAADSGPHVSTYTTVVVDGDDGHRYYCCPPEPDDPYPFGDRIEVLDEVAAA